MMNIEKLKQDLILNGQDPDDFTIEVNESGYSITPKWFYENKQIAKEQDKPIIDDVNIVAETSTFTAMDVNDLAEMLLFALTRIDELEARLNG